MLFELYEIEPQVVDSLGLLGRHAAEISRSGVDVDGVVVNFGQWHERISEVHNLRRVLGSNRESEASTSCLDR